MFEAKIECPRCHRIWIVPQGQEAGECVCHLYCTQGNAPSDCPNFTYPYNFNGSLAWPHGSDQDEVDEGHDRIHATGYCSTHKEYVYKTPIYLEVNWEKWRLEKAPAKFQTLKM